ncbi:MAG: hypothetical protein ABI382_11605 [Nakamurella sp.]
MVPAMMERENLGLQDDTCSAAVVLARLAGPRQATLTAADAARVGLTGPPPWELSRPNVRIALYQWALATGAQFDTYRWISLIDLAAVWRELHLPEGIHEEWENTLRSAELID